MTVMSPLALRSAAILLLALAVQPAWAEAPRTLRPNVEPRLVAEAMPAPPKPGDQLTAALDPVPERKAGAIGPWYVEGSFGLLNPGNFTDIMFRPDRTSIEGESMAQVAVGREILDFGAGFSAELGLLLGHRIDEGGFEVAAPFAIVFDGFPWRDKLPMRLRLAVGPSFVSEITPTEKRKADNGKGSKVLNMFNPEIEIGAPGAPEWSGFFRLHHRSGIFGLVDGVTGGSTYMMVGLRHRFSAD